MAGILIVDQIQNSSNTGQLTFDNSGNFTTGNLICSGTITGGTGLLNIGSGQIYKDTNGNVGIGTSSPTQKLQVVSASGGTTARFINVNTGNFIDLYETNTSTRLGYIGTTDGTNWTIHNDKNGYIGFDTNNTEKMRLDASGNLGLGVTPSAWNSGVKSIQIKNSGVWSTSNDLNLFANAYYGSGGSTYTSSAVASAFQMANGAFYWQTAASGTAGNAISFTQAMTLEADGRLLIGTTSWTSSTVGLKVQGGSGADKCQIGSVVNGDWNVELYGTGGNRVRLFTSAGGGTQVGSITCSTTNATFNTSSDERLKTNITPAGSAIQSILDFPVDQFDWIESGDHQDFGGVAQKVLPIIPEMVSIPANEDEMWGIDWSKAVPRLIKTIQELSAQNKALEDRIAALESK